MTCHACGAPLAATAKFCHKCGAQVGGGQAAAWRVGLPWGVAGAALGALLTVVVFRLGTSTGVITSACSISPAMMTPAPSPRRTRSAAPSRRISSQRCCGPGRSSCGATRRGRAGRTPSSSGTRRRSAPAGGPNTPSTRTTSTPSTLKRPRSPPDARVPARRTIRLAHSPDADDAFMFWALAAGKIDTGTRHYQHELADIETLNRRALKGELEVTAVLLHAYAHLADRYALLAHGASIGDRYGPRLVARTRPPADVRAALAAPGALVAVPGELTTAFLTLKLYQPAARHVVVPFDQIEDYVAAGRADAGLLIHEGQLTYGDRGLHLWVDLGEWWYQETGGPLPLGGNVVRRDLGAALMHDVARDLRASIQYALGDRREALGHAETFRRGLDVAVPDA